MSVPKNTNPNFGRCRLFGHAWHDVTSDWYRDSGQEQPLVSPITVRCERCDTERRDQVDKFGGDLYHRKYFYPIGYLMDHAEDRPTRSEFRVWFVNEQIAKSRERKRKS